jgi:hypothetical protein
MIDSHHPINFRYRLCRTLFDAQLVVDATNLAHSHGRFCRILSVTRDYDPSLFGNELNNPLGTRVDTIAASHAFYGINHWEAINHGDSTKLTCLGTISKANATVLAVQGACKGQGGTSARSVADIAVLFVNLSLNFGAVHDSDHLFNGLSGFSSYLGNCIGYRFFSRKT